MHISDGLISPTVALATGTAAAMLIAVSAMKIKRSNSEPPFALMGVMGAFVFAAQMLNFSIPGTGSSGHIIGGVLLAAMLGPWGAFLTLSAVLVIQCLVFADGGLMALGCNIINMGAVSCLLAYPFIFKPMVGGSLNNRKIMAASVTACVAGLLIGAFFVSVETVASGVTVLPFGKFLMFMIPIHFVIGIMEGLATGAVLCFVWKARPALLEPVEESMKLKKGGFSKGALIGIFAVLAIVGGVVVSQYASSNPDGLEWSIGKVTGSTEIAPEGKVAKKAEKIQQQVASMPDYEDRYSGLVGCIGVMTLAGGTCFLLRRRSLKSKASGSVSKS